MSVVHKCCWCGGKLAAGRVLRTRIWACKTEACYERCANHMLTWQERSDRTKSGMSQPKLFFFPLPRQVQAIESVLAGEPRILYGGARGGGVV